MKLSRASLRRIQRVAGLGLALLTVLLLANSAFLATSFSPEGLVVPMQRSHVALGFLLGLALIGFAGSHLVLHRHHRNAAARRIGLIVAGIALLGCGAGVALWVVGKSSAVRTLVILHEGAFVAALLAYVLHRRRAMVTPVLRPERLAAVAAVVLGAAIWAAQLWWPTSNPAPEAPRPEFAAGLSQARTVDGHVLRPEDLDDPGYCAQCHASIAKRWESSAHRVSSLNDPFYAKTLAYAQTHREPDQLKFCGGCHDPLLLLTGRMDEHPVPGQPATDAGITCLACHAITQEPSTLGNGSYVVGAPEHYPGYDAQDPDEREESRRLIRSMPAQHVASFSKPFLRSSTMCVGCHKAFIPSELNGHRWLPGQNEYDAWHQSGAGGNSARTFYKPGAPKTCQSCHMPQLESDDPAAGADGTVADHAFLGANTALARAREDEAWVSRNRAFLEGVLSVDVGAVAVTDSTGATQRQLAPESPVSLPAGHTVTLDVVVRNLKSGHLYPGGITDLREAWLEVSVLTESDEALVARGWLDPEGGLDPDAHQWNTVLLDGDGAPLRVHDVEDTHAVLVSRRIMLGASDIVRVSFEAPSVATRVELRVLDRKLPPAYVEFALGPEAAPVPVTEVARAQLRLEPGEFVPRSPDPESGARLRNLGIGHLLRGDTTLAREAALEATSRLPTDPGPWLDLARGALEDGALERAEAHVRSADALSPGHPTAAWLLASIRSAQGNHEAALAALDVALEAFPLDRELLAMKGDSLFRLEREQEAGVVLEAVLAIDPEHLAAHALLTRIRTEQGDEAGAKRHREAWDRVRPHSEDQVFTERARRADPALDRRANRQFVVTLAAVPKGWTRADTAR